ncbi:MAG TPA: hypothetical protein VLL51_04455 [Gemmatimonadales bacterium]|nr:hypothetical protein [Gemmatimonadales bacterium]
MNLRTAGKAVLVGLLLLAVPVALGYGLAHLVLGAGWAKLGGAALIAAAGRAAVLALDLVWERHPHFSARPWERPWERDDRSA